uniref:HNH endonuclease n=1 Tax=viral metagenome TaxID=1070528 RepID=A0A6C0JGV3_9ZZZZ
MEKNILVNLLKPEKKKKKEKKENMVDDDDCDENREIAEKIPKKRNITKEKKWRVKPYQLLPETQVELINQISEGIYDTRASDLMANQINSKIASYKCQDISKKLFSEEEFVDFEKVLELLKKCENKCFYCKKLVHILYENVREPLQWTLERIDNDFGHNKSNVEIACLNCNLHRRTMHHERYLFTKELNILKILE